jgi:phosphatidylserine/phosphatidylglycerophosphate/cardiolipin synthase-like enzyme
MFDNSTLVTTSLSFLLFASYFFLISTKTNYEALDCMKYAKEQLIKGNRVEGVFFVPDDPVKKLLIGLIYFEKKSIKAAVYQLTDPDIFNALLDARRRGVTVEIITDKSCLASKYEKVTKLRKHGAKVYVYGKHFSLMHNKIWNFSVNILNKSLVMAGSANTTQGGLTRNEENVIVVDRREVVTAYREKFDRLKQKITTSMKPTKDVSTDQPSRFSSLFYTLYSLFDIRWIFD